MRYSSRIDEGGVYVREAIADFWHCRQRRARIRSRRGPVVHPPDPSLASPIPQHLEVTRLIDHVEWRFLIEGDKGMAQEQQKPFLALFRVPHLDGTAAKCVTISIPAHLAAMRSRCGTRTPPL